MFSFVIIIFFFSFFFFIRPTARRKPEAVPVSDTGEAQKKFGGDVKAISSDMYFGKQDNSEVRNDNMSPTHPTCCVYCNIHCVTHDFDDDVLTCTLCGFVDGQ